MTISSQTFRWSYSSAGGVDPYPYTNKILAESDLKFYVGTTLKTLNTDYTVSGVGNAGGGNITPLAAITAGATVLIVKDGVEFTQETDYTENDSFPAASHEDALDKLTNIAQKIWDYTRRSIKVAITSTLTDLEFPSPSASKLFGWDATATVIQNYSVTDISALVVSDFGASMVMSNNSASALDLIGWPAISAAGASLVEATTASAMKTILNIPIYMFSARASASYLISPAAYTKVTFATERFDPDGVFANSTFTAPVDGYYNLMAALVFFTASATQNAVMKLVPYKNGSLFNIVATNKSSSASTEFGATWADVVSLNAGDTVEIYTYSNSDAAVSVYVEGHPTLGYSYFSGVKL